MDTGLRQYDAINIFYLRVFACICVHLWTNIFQLFQCPKRVDSALSTHYLEGEYVANQGPSRNNVFNSSVLFLENKYAKVIIYMT